CAAVVITLPLTFKLYGLQADTMHLALILILIHNCSAIFLWPSAFTLSNVLRAANDVTFPMIVSIASMIIVRLGMGYLLAFHFNLGAIGVWVAMILDWIVRIAFFATRYRSGKWKTFYHADADAI
ncbi:MAG: MATE family efflux transporter, partial [Eubacteriales bacterium]|nr:MATE family efflux transporter [Eubacteriales bacterium]